MAEQETQLISKIVTDNTQTPVGEGGGRGKLRWGGGMQQEWEMLYQNLQLLITAPWLPLTITHHRVVNKRQTHGTILRQE